MRLVWLALTLTAAGCGSAPANNKGSPGTVTTGSGTAMVDDSDWQAMIQIGVEACRERGAANPGAGEDGVRRACECAVPRLMDGKSVEAVQAMWRDPAYPRHEAEAANQCLAGGA